MNVGVTLYVVCLELWLFIDSSVINLYRCHVPLPLVHTLRKTDLLLARSVIAIPLHNTASY